MASVKDFGRGSVVRITLRNFLTYDDVTVRPGPQLNLLIGPNGSGKSTIVAALVLGLAGSPDVLGRDLPLASFIKEGAREGFIELELFDPLGNHVISRTIQKKTSTWTYNGQEKSEADVKKVTADLNIQVDNMCQILPQERVQDFVRMNAQELLVGTEKAVGYRGMHEDHLFLQDKDKKKDDLNQEIVNFDKDLEKVEEEIKVLQPDVDGQQIREMHEKKAKKLRHRREWLKYELSERECQKLSESKEAAERELERSRRELQPQKERLAKLKEQERCFEMKLKTCITAQRAKCMLVNEERAHAKEAEDVLENHVNDQREYERREASRQQREDRLKEKLLALRSQLECADQGEALRDEIGDCAARINTLSDRVNRCQEKLDDDHREQDELEGRVNGFNLELNRVRSVDVQRLKQLERHRDVYNAVLWLRENRSMFSHPIHEPMILLLDVDDSRMAKYVQGAVPWRDLLAFTCESRDDMNIFLRELRERRQLRISCVLSDPNIPLESLRPQRSQDQLLNLGFQRTVGDLFTAPEAVRRYLFKTHKVQNIPVADVQGEMADRVLRATQGQNINSFMIGDLKYRSGQSQYGKRLPWTNSKPLDQPDRLLTLTTDTTRERPLLQKIKEATERLQELGETKKAAQDSLNDLTSQLEVARCDKKRLTKQRDHRRNLESSYNMTEKILVQLKKEKCDLPMKALETSTLIEGQLKRLATVQQKLFAACEACQALEISSGVLSAQLDLAKQHTRKADRELSDASENLKELETRVKVTTHAVVSHRSKSRQLRRDALTLMGRAEGEQVEGNLKEYFALLPNTMEQVDAEIGEAEFRAKMLTTDDDPVRRYKQLKKQKDKIVEKLEELRSDLRQLREDTLDCRNRWLKDFEEIVTGVNEHFGSFFRDMGCAGEVALFKPEGGHAAEYGITIRVKFRASEQLCALNETHQSGGERSVATMLYVMALQCLQRTSVPFHCVDEINQGMDERNERRVFELVMSAACRHGAQYFLITPKLLPGLLRGALPGLTVLCVFSPAVGPRDDWDTAALLLRKRRQQRRWV